MARPDIGRNGSSKREWFWFAGFILALCSVLGLKAWIGNRSFEAMSPAQHLEAARLALGDHDYDQGLRHVDAITAKKPEDVGAKRAREDILAAIEQEHLTGEFVEKQIAAKKAAKDLEAAAVRDLQESLKNLGYDLTVERSDRPSEIIIKSKDFEDTDHRIRFLSFLRGPNSPTSQVCMAGFQMVRLRSSVLFGFSETYPLECFSRR